LMSAWLGAIDNQEVQGEEKNSMAL
jgi:hypothetical protein